MYVKQVAERSNYLDVREILQDTKDMINKLSLSFRAPAASDQPYSKHVRDTLSEFKKVQWPVVCMYYVS